MIDKDIIIKNKILNYIHNLQDREYAKSLIDVADFTCLFKCCSDILKSYEESDIQNALLLIRDLSNGTISPEITEEVRRCITYSEIFNELERLLYVENYFIRSSVIYTIGKISFKENISSLLKAFLFYLKGDPLNMPDMIFELFWLGDKNPDYINKLVCHEHFLFRWSVFEILDSLSIENKYDKMNGYISVLRKDENNYVKAQAEYFYKKIILKEKSLKPTVDFSSMKRLFLNYLWKENQRDYTVIELENFLFSIRC